GVGDLLDLADEFADLAFAPDAQAPFAGLDLQPGRGEGAGENQFARVMGNIDEAAGARIEAAELADVHIALRVELGEGQCGEFAIAAVDEVELIETVEQTF